MASESHASDLCICYHERQDHIGTGGACVVVGPPADGDCLCGAFVWVARVKEAAHGV